MFYIISYDIVDDKIRSKIAKYLEGRAVRVQKSVFEADWNQKLLAETINDIKNIINPNTDSVRIYRLCSQCQAEILNFGYIPIYHDENVKIV